MIPLVNIIIIIIIWGNIAAKLGKTKWHGLLLFLPLVGTIDLGYLAFSDSGGVIPGAGIKHEHTALANPDLVNYIRQNLAQGHSREDLEKVLFDAGWHKEDIDLAMRQV